MYKVFLNRFQINLTSKAKFLDKTNTFLLVSIERGGLYFETGTPTVVATTYAAYGLFDAYEAIGEKKYLDAAIDSTNFVLKDLSRDYKFVVLGKAHAFE